MEHPYHLYRMCRGLTLLDVVVIVVAVLLLIGLVVPPHRNNESPLRTKCMNNLRQIGTALSTYESQKNVRCPWGPMGRIQTDPKNLKTYIGGLYDSGNGVLGDANIFQCPDADPSYEDRPCHYLRSWWDLGTLRPDVVIAGDIQGLGAGDPGNHAREYSNFLFKDCHVRSWTFSIATTAPLVATGIDGAADAADDVYNDIGDAATGSATRTALIYNDG